MRKEVNISRKTKFKEPVIITFHFSFTLKSVKLFLSKPKQNKIHIMFKVNEVALYRWKININVWGQNKPAAYMIDLINLNFGRYILHLTHTTHLTIFRKYFLMLFIRKWKARFQVSWINFGAQCGLLIRFNILLSFSKKIIYFYSTKNIVIGNAWAHSNSYSINVSHNSLLWVSSWRQMNSIH